MSLVIVLALVLAVQRPSGERVREASGAELVLEGGVLFRERDGVRRTLGCTDPDGTGVVLDLALDPAGNAFVAAERGLFVLGPFVDALDPVARLEGAPRGRPTSVYVDAARRVWLATDEQLGVLDPSFFWGRTLASDALPGDGPWRVRAADGGRIWISCAAGERCHDPSAGPAPRITRWRIDGRELARDAVLDVGTGARIRVDVEGEAAGGATFRYRFDGHHVWRELVPGSSLVPPAPGAHTLELLAVDQELDRSAPVLARLRVAYPTRYRAAVVLGALAAAAALLLALFLWRGRTLAGRVRPIRALASTALVLVFALQIAAGLEPHAKGWPFVGFGMYTRASSAGEIVYREELVALRADGSELAVRPQGAGVTVDELWEVARPLIDGGEPALRAFLAAWRRRFPALDVRGLQVQARRSRLTADGPVAIAPLVLAHYRESSGG